MIENYPIKKITGKDAFYFKPYYDMQPWSASGRFFICMRSDFQHRPPVAGEKIQLGVVDLEDNNKFVPVAETSAWNFQQGCMPHWLPSSADSKIIYNDVLGDEAKALCIDINNGEKNIYDKPVQALSPDGRKAAGLNFGRWGIMRPGYGYAGVKDPWEDTGEALGDYVHLMDMETGKWEKIVEMGNITKLSSDHDGRRGTTKWFNHLMFNTDGSRLAGLVRCWAPHMAADVYRNKENVDGAVAERRHTMWCVDINSGQPDIVVNDGMVSHAEWRDPEHILAFANSRPEQKPGYFVFDVRDGSYDIIGEESLTEDGHMSYHKNRDWLLTDTYPDSKRNRTLKLYNIPEKREVVLGRFYSPDLYGKSELRCDLHPCWNRNYNQIAIDSIHEDNKRSVYIIDIGNIDDLC